MTSQPIISLETATPPFFLGVDLGGTSVKIGVLDNAGATVAFSSIPTIEEAGPQDAVFRMAEAARTLVDSVGLSMLQIGRVGLGSPGPMCLQTGTLLESPNLPHWHHFPIRDALATATERPVSLVNDANAAAYGEYWVGTGSSHSSLILLTLGTGVGGGIIHEGRLINGLNGFGSECGHVIVDSSPQARLCVWGGGRGELEAYSSASAVAVRAVELAAEHETCQLGKLYKTQGSLSAKDVYNAAKNGDELALQIIDETAKYLGIGISTAVAIIDPGLVVLGGAMNFGGAECALGRRFLSAIIDEFERRAFSNVFRGTKIDFASLGADAGYIGAAGIARSDFESPAS